MKKRTKQTAKNPAAGTCGNLGGPAGFLGAFLCAERVCQPGGDTERLLSAVMQERFPGETFHTEGRADRAFIWDGSGNEYFLGNRMECAEGSAAETVCWNFPDEEEDDPQVPFA